MINNPDIQKCFPVLDRVLMKMGRFAKFNCSRQFKSYVEYMGGSVETNDKDVRVENATLMDKCGYFNIIDSSNLELDPNVMHPFVKVHIIDMITGNYIEKSSTKPAMSYYETITTFVKTEKKFTLNSCDIIIPFATKCYDLRESGNSRAIWNESPYFFQN